MDILDLKILNCSYVDRQKRLWREGGKLFSLSLRDHKKYEEIVNSDEYKEMNRLEHEDSLKEIIAISEMTLELAKRELDAVKNKKPVWESVVGCWRG